MIRKRVERKDLLTLFLNNCISYKSGQQEDGREFQAGARNKAFRIEFLTVFRRGEQFLEEG